MVLTDFIELLLARNGSELLLTPDKPPSLRLPDGLHFTSEEPLEESLIEKLASEALDSERRADFERTGSLTIGYRPPGFRQRFRLSFFRRLGRMALVIRTLESGARSLGELNLPPTVARLTDFERGLVVVSGSSSSGRSNTLAALVHQVNSRLPVHLVTLEDPVEFLHEELMATISQREVGTDVSDWAEALRSAPMSSPDVIVVDEVRDQDAMMGVLRWALSGRLVICTVEGADVVDTINNMLSLCPASGRTQRAAELGLCLKGILCQKLVPAADQRGWIPATELLIPDYSISGLIREQRIDEVGEFLRGCNEPGMFSFNQSLAALFRNGLIRRDIALAYCGNELEFRSAIGETRASEPRRNWDLMTLLQLAVEHNASDLHLSEGRPPILRIGGELEKLNMPRLRSRDIRAMLYSVLTGAQRAGFEKDRELDLSLAIDRGHRFRVNAFYQKGCVAAAFRTIPSRIPESAELGIPDALIRLAQKPHGLILVVGPTG
ncbi:MAG: Flp pilus assembly complex ATPase component TadA, partial [Candidatus Eremiobacteraeota bacterium]|nr:Flp pilus assembly complex ATPase component TadA [Candidatus Eremiobacteraeota bacterium]